MEGKLEKSQICGCQTTSGSKKESQEITEHILRQMKTETQRTETYETQRGSAERDV